MTIDQHFVLMILLEFGIFFLGIWVVHRGQKEQTKLIHDVVHNPEYAAAVITNMTTAILDRIEKDPVLQEKVMCLASTVGVNAYNTITKYVMDHGEELVDQAKDKIRERVKMKFHRKHFLKPAEGIINEMLPYELEKLREGQKLAKRAKNVVTDTLAFVSDKK